MTTDHSQYDKKIDELLHGSEYADNVIEALREPFLILDQDLIVRNANRAFCSAFAVTREETLNRRIYELGNHQWNIPVLSTLLEEMLPQNRVIENYLVQHTFPVIGARTVLLNARRLELEVDQPARILLAFEDITAREEAKQFERSAATFAHLVERAPFGIYVIDSKFRVASVSEGARPAFRNVDPLIGRDFGEAIQILWPAPLASEIIDIFQQTLASGDPYIAPVLTETRVDLDAVESYEWQVHRVMLPDGEYGVVCYFFDSTAIRAAEKLAHENEQLAIRANRVKSEFLAHVSHEIRTPMSAVLGYAELLLNQLTEQSNRHYVEIIKTSGESLVRLVDDLLDLASMEAGKLDIESGRCELDVLLAETMSLVQVRAAEKHIMLTLDYATKLPRTIEIDAGRLQQILLNLLSNAIKFTDEGEVRLRASYLAEPESSVQFEVTDTGIGMSRKRQEKIFQPFERASRRAYGGTGLGLAISYQLTERMQGTLHAKSKLHQGSTFTLTIPTGVLDGVDVVTPRKVIVVADKVAMPDPQLTGRRVLIVDDQREIRELLRQFVENANGKAKVVSNGQLALDAVVKSEAESQPFDAVVLDIRMPVMDGFSTATALRQRGFSAPIIAITADALRGDREQCLAAGCDAYMNKPIVGHALLQKLHRLIGSKTRDRILIVDDSRDAADALSALLDVQGFETQTAYGGASALEMIEVFSPDVVLLDISMPGMDGYQVAEEIRKRPVGEGIVLIALTGHDSEEDQRRSHTAGFEHHLTKPVSINKLLGILQH